MWCDTPAATDRWRLPRSQVSRLLRFADSLLGHSERALPVQMAAQPAAPVGMPRAHLCYMLRWSGLAEALLVLLQTPACLASSRLMGAARHLLHGQWTPDITGLLPAGRQRWGLSCGVCTGVIPAALLHFWFYFEVRRLL